MAVIVGSSFGAPVLYAAPVIPVWANGAMPSVHAEGNITVVLASTAGLDVTLVVSASDMVTVLDGRSVEILYAQGYPYGELYGFSSPREHVMEPILLGETDDDKKTISFHLYTLAGLPASGILGEGAICVPVGVQLQTNRDLAGYVNSTGTFTHVGDGLYRYTFATPEVAAGAEGNIWLRIKVPGYRTAILRTPLRIPAPTAIEIRDAIFSAARAGYLTTGSIGEGIAITTALLQGNFYMDTVVNTGNGQTSARIRCFSSGAGVQAATPGGSGQGEFATFTVSTTYTGPNKVSEHRVVQQ